MYIQRFTSGDNMRTEKAQQRASASLSHLVGRRQRPARGTSGSPQPNAISVLACRVDVLVADGDDPGSVWRRELLLLQAVALPQPQLVARRETTTGNVHAVAIALLGTE